MGEEKKENRKMVSIHEERVEISTSRKQKRVTVNKKYRYATLLLNNILSINTTYYTQ